MRIRKHSRITAFALALVMILPLISIPAFAEGEAAEEILPVNWSQDFDEATNLSDVMSSFGSATKIENGAYRIDYKADGSSGDYYVSTKTTAIGPAKISNPVWDGDTLTGGTATIGGVTYNVTGKLNGEETRNNFTEKATLTSTTDANVTYTANDVYVVSAASRDAIHGGYNVAKANSVKNPAVSATDYKKVVLSADYFISEEVNTGATFEITWNSVAKSVNTRVDIAKLEVQGDYIRLNWHADAKTIQNGSSYYDSSKNIDTALRTPKGTWFNVKAIMDLVTGNIELYLNGEYGATVTDADLPTGLKANAFNVAQINRGSTQAPAEMAGYVLVDNVSVSTDVTVYSNADFDAYEGISAFRGGTYMNNFAYPGGIPSKLEAVTENGNTYLKYNYGADLLGDSNFNASSNASVDADGDGIVDFQANSGYTRWEKNQEIAGYDLDTNILTLKDGTEITITAQSDENIALGFYGTFTYTDSKVYRLTTPLYAAANQFGDGNIDKNIAIRVSPYSYEDYDEVYFSAKYFIEENSYGKAQSQFYNLVKNGTATTWNDLYTIDLATGKLEVAASKGSTYLPIGEWCEVGLKINLDTGDVTYYVDGVLLVKYAGQFGANIAFRNGATNYGGCGWIVAKQFKNVSTVSAQGSVSVDDVKMTALSEMPDVIYSKVDFERETVGSAPSTSSIPTMAHSNTVVDDTLGSKAWKFDYERTGGTAVLNIDKNSRVKHPALSYLEDESIVFEADYFIEGSAFGKLQSQVNPFQSNGANVGNGWNDLYQIDYNVNGAGDVILKREGGTDHGYGVMKAGRWHTVSAVVNLITGKLDIYLDGELVIDSWLVMKDQTAATNLTAAANKWIVGKVNKVDGKGSVYVDNLKVYASTTPTDTTPEPEKEVLDFEEFAFADGMSARKSGLFYAPALLTFTKQATGNVALRLGMGAASSADDWALYSPAGSGKVLSWSVTREVMVDEETSEPIINEETGEPYMLVDGQYVEERDNLDDPFGYVWVYDDATATDVKYWVLPADYAEAAQNGTNVGSATTIKHDDYSYKDVDTVVFQADYFIEPGSTGIIESQFAGFYYDVITVDEGTGEETATSTKGGWLQLFHLYMDSGLVWGQNSAGGVNGNGNYYATIGAWNTFKVVANLKTGVFEIYVNDVWARTYDCGYDNLTLGSSDGKMDWSFAKVQRHNDYLKGPYEGALLIDNFTVYSTSLTTSESYGDKFLTDAAYDAYVADLLTVVDGASIRLTDPAGLRFATKVNTAKLNHLKKIYKDATVQMGTLITPADYLESTENVDRETLDAIVKANKYLDVKFDGTYYSGAADLNLEEGADYMVGSIVNLYQKNVTRDFAALGYVELVVQVDEETTTTIGGVYSDVVVRNVKEVAQAAIDAGMTNDILTQFAAGNTVGTHAS